MAIGTSWIEAAEGFVPEGLKPQRLVLTVQRGSVFITSGPGITERTKQNLWGSLMPEVQTWAMPRSERKKTGA